MSDAADRSPTNPFRENTAVGLDAPAASEILHVGMLVCCPRPIDAPLLPSDLSVLNWLREALTSPSVHANLWARGPRDRRGLKDSVKRANVACGPIQIVHFDGHAASEPHGTTYRFESRRTAATEPVLAGELADALRVPDGSSFLLFIGACDGFPGHTERAALLDAGAVAVLGFEGRVDATDVRHFAQALYTRLVTERVDLRDAFEVACDAAPRVSAQARLDGHDAWRLDGTAEIPATDAGVRILDDVGGRISMVRDPSLAVPETLEPLRELVQFLLTRQDQLVCSVHGPEGTGRHTVACHAARRAAFHYDDIAHLHLPQKGRPYSAEELACSALRALGDRPSSPDEMPRPSYAAALAEHTRHRRVLLLIDEIDDVRRIDSHAATTLSQELHDSARVVAISREYVPGTRSIGVGPIRPETVDRLRSELGATDASVVLLERLLAVMRERSDAHVPIERLASSGAVVDLDETRGGLAVLLRLPADLSALVRGLAALPDPLRREDITTVHERLAATRVPFPGDPIPPVARALDELMAAGALLPGDGQVFTLERSVQRAADALPDSPVVQLEALNALVDRNGLADSAALFLEWAARRLRGGGFAGHDREVAARVERCIHSAASVWFREDRLGDTAWAWSVAASAWERAGAVREAARSLVEMGDRALEAGDLGLARAAGQRLERLAGCSQADEERDGLLARASYYQAVAFRRQGALRAARDSYGECKQLCVTHAGRGNPQRDRELITVLREAAEVDRELGNLADARRSLEEALERARRLPTASDDEMVGVVLDRLGYLVETMGRLDEAEAFYAEALERVERRPQRAILLLKSLGDIAARRGDHLDAQQRYMEGIRRAREQDDRGLEAYVSARRFRELVRARQSQDEALRLLNTIFELVRYRTGLSSYRVFQTLLEMAEGAALLGTAGRLHAEDFVRHADRILERRSFAPLIADRTRTIALIRKAHCQHGTEGSPADWREAAEAFAEAFGRYDDCGALWRAWRCRLHEADCLRQAGAVDDARALYGEAGAWFATAGDVLREERAQQQLRSLVRSVTGSP